MPLPNILDLGYLPALLRDHPAAVVPYLVGCDDFIARLYHQHTGYWQTDRGSTRAARKKQRRLWTCSPGKSRTHSPTPVPLWPARAT